jgi:hypothetical protein
MITTFRCTAKQIIAEKFGTKKDGSEYHRLDYLVEGGGGPHSRPYSVAVTFYSNNGPVQRRPEIGRNIMLTVSVTARPYEGKWYNEVRALEFEYVPDVKEGGQDEDNP